MPYRISYDERCEKKLIKFIKAHPDMLERYEKTLTILSSNPSHPSLRLHKLRGKLKEYHSVSISMQYRIVIDFVITEESIILLDIGGHDEVY